MCWSVCRVMIIRAVVMVCAPFSVSVPLWAQAAKRDDQNVPSAAAECTEPKSWLTCPWEPRKEGDGGGILNRYPAERGDSSGGPMIPHKSVKKEEAEERTFDRPGAFKLPWGKGG